MSTSHIVSLLADRPQGELDALKAKLEAEQEKLAEAAARVELELEQVDDAISRQSRKRGTRGQRTSRRRQSGGPTTFEQVTEFIRQSHGPVAPADAKEALVEHGWSGSGSAIYNAFRRLVDSGEIVKLGDGLYQTASPNGSESETTPGTQENGANEQLSTATWPQEGG